MAQADKQVSAGQKETTRKKKGMVESGLESLAEGFKGYMSQFQGRAQSKRDDSPEGKQRIENERQTVENWIGRKLPRPGDIELPPKGTWRSGLDKFGRKRK